MSGSWPRRVRTTMLSSKKVMPQDFSRIHGYRTHITKRKVESYRPKNFWLSFALKPTLFVFEGIHQEKREVSRKHSIHTSYRGPFPIRRQRYRVNHEHGIPRTNELSTLINLRQETIIPNGECSLYPRGYMSCTTSNSAFSTSLENKFDLTGCRSQHSCGLVSSRDCTGILWGIKERYHVMPAYSTTGTVCFFARPRDKII